MACLGSGLGRCRHHQDLHDALGAGRAEELLRSVEDPSGCPCGALPSGRLGGLVTASTGRAFGGSFSAHSCSSIAGQDQLEARRRVGSLPVLGRGASGEAGSRRLEVNLCRAFAVTKQDDGDVGGFFIATLWP